MILLEYQDINTFLQKATFQIGIFKEVFMIQKIENTVPWTHVIQDLNGKKIVGTFSEKKCKNKSKRV